MDSTSNDSNQVQEKIKFFEAISVNHEEALNAANTECNKLQTLVKSLESARNSEAVKVMEASSELEALRAELDATRKREEEVTKNHQAELHALQEQYGEREAQLRVEWLVSHRLRHLNLSP